ncbi:uncharacterized protein LOC130612465 isoform X2 [Hydractinia symbiolongicarpus]|uniref:uncharacterized protein LOC130612465 isoform X2 n=1 Tax=Hydractinia symbiolongicarpus TaxID=13093 RepID=UPI0025505CE1|nr:uncharacterized protein LOC130612465 isoform X2 [Hydractinia symbiolongicarpus]
MDRCTLLHLVVFLFIVVYNAKCEETRHYKFNPQLCDLNQKISAHKLSVVPQYASTLEVESTAKCQAVYHVCQSSQPSDKQRCCRMAQNFCLIYGKNSPCQLYCGCWLKRCEL